MHNLLTRTTRILFVVGILALLPLMTPHATAAQSAGRLHNGSINLAHLQFLTEPITVNGRDMAIVHIYSEYPKYQWVDAGNEGISALDDVARASIVYLHYYQATGDRASLDLARRCLNFVLYMQTDDGEFYNFVSDRAGTINKTGDTSYKSLGWWAMRGIWALAEGINVFDNIDHPYADELAAAYLRTEKAYAATFHGDQTYNLLHGFKIPGWFGGSADVAGLSLLALTRYQQARPNDTTAALMLTLGDGLAAYRLGDAATYPFGMHPVTSNAPGYWHDWGAHMVQALAAGGALLHRQSWIDSAAADADQFLIRQIAFERVREVGILPNRYGQIAYGTNILVQSFLEVARATGDNKYRQYAGLAASWFTGNNLASVAMYDPATGRTFDGIEGSASWRVNQNAGAESTIEGLMALIAVTNDPIANGYLNAKTSAETPYTIAEAENGKTITGKPTYKSGSWTGESSFSNDHYEELHDGDAIDVPLTVATDGDYRVYLSHLRHISTETPLHVEAVHAATPPTLDGNLSDWANVPAFKVDQSSQFLRGAAQWQGADKANFTVRLMWDADNLYIASEVHAPTPHHQPEVGPGVWRYDTLWVYVDATGHGSRVDAKFTLAQTPKGPQVWDWKAGFFMPHAQLAWHEIDGSYVYEAAIPFRSLRARAPQVGMTLGVQIGRGWGGDSFMDLNGGDPDTASNLVPLTLVEHAGDLQKSAAPAVANTDPNAVAIRVSIDGGAAVTLPENTSPDRAYLWLDSLGIFPLTHGDHVLHIAYAGTAKTLASQIDGFLIQPVVATKTFRLPNGQSITLQFDTRTGLTRLSDATF